MNEEALAAAIEQGRQAIRSLAPKPKVVLLGEMGIGNTTPASAVSARLLGLSAEDIVGPGTGITGELFFTRLVWSVRLLSAPVGLLNRWMFFAASVDAKSQRLWVRSSRRRRMALVCSWMGSSCQLRHWWQSTLSGCPRLPQLWPPFYGPGHQKLLTEMD